MRIVVHGQQAFGKAVLEALLKRGENVVAVYVAPEKPGAKADPLKEAALAANLPVYQPASYKDPKVWEEFKALKPDLQVMAFVTLFVPEDFLNIPTHGSIQYHPSLLPAYRGASAINWPIIKGEKETGLSIFWPDNGLDTGDVLLQKKTPISDTDTLGTVYFDRLFPMGVEAMLESVDLVKAGKAPRIKQDESKATYEGMCKADNARIDWGKPWEQIDRLIRGCNPAPGAWSTLDGKAIKIFEAKPLPAKDPKGIAGKLGEIVAVEADGVTVVCADGRFKVTRVQPPEGKKIGAGEWAATVRPRQGRKVCLTGERSNDHRTTRLAGCRRVCRRCGLCQRLRASGAAQARRPRNADAMETRLQTRRRHAGFAVADRHHSRSRRVVAKPELAVACRLGEPYHALAFHPFCHQAHQRHAARHRAATGRSEQPRLD